MRHSCRRAVMHALGGVPDARQRPLPDRSPPPFDGNAPLPFSWRQKKKKYKADSLFPDRFGVGRGRQHDCVVSLALRAAGVHPGTRAAEPLFTLGASPPPPATGLASEWQPQHDDPGKAPADARL
jgi:hypothetical protein